MNRKDLAAQLATRQSLPKSKSLEIVTSIFNDIEEALLRGETVKITNFGAFEAKTSVGREYRNPATGGKVFVPERKMVKFRVGKGLRNKTLALTEDLPPEPGEEKVTVLA